MRQLFVAVGDRMLNRLVRGNTARAQCTPGQQAYCMFNGVCATGCAVTTCQRNENCDIYDCGAVAGCCSGCN